MSKFLKALKKDSEFQQVDIDRFLVDITGGKNIDEIVLMFQDYKMKTKRQEAIDSMYNSYKEDLEGDKKWCESEEDLFILMTAHFGMEVIKKYKPVSSMKGFDKWVKEEESDEE